MDACRIIEDGFVVFLIGMRMPETGPGLAGPAHDLSVPSPAGPRRPRAAKRGSPKSCGARNAYRRGDGLYAFAGFIRCGSWVKRNIKNRQLS